MCARVQSCTCLLCCHPVLRFLMIGFILMCRAAHIITVITGKFTDFGGCSQISALFLSLPAQEGVPEEGHESTPEHSIDGGSVDEEGVGANLLHDLEGALAEGDEYGADLTGADQQQDMEVDGGITMIPPPPAGQPPAAPTGQLLPGGSAAVEPTFSIGPLPSIAPELNLDAVLGSPTPTKPQPQPQALPQAQAGRPAAAPEPTGAGRGAPSLALQPPQLQLLPHQEAETQLLHFPELAQQAQQQLPVARQQQSAQQQESALPQTLPVTQAQGQPLTTSQQLFAAPTQDPASAHQGVTAGQATQAAAGGKRPRVDGSEQGTRMGAAGQGLGAAGGGLRDTEKEELLNQGTVAWTAADQEKEALLWAAADQELASLRQGAAAGQSRPPQAQQQPQQQPAHQQLQQPQQRYMTTPAEQQRGQPQQAQAPQPQHAKQPPEVMAIDDDDDEELDFQL